MSVINIRGVDYTLEDNISDIHLTTLESFLQAPTDFKLQSSAGYILKYAVFTEPLPDELVKEVKDKCIIKLSGAEILEVLPKIWLAFYKQRLGVLKAKAETEEDKAKFDKAETNLETILADKNITELIKNAAKEN